MILEICASSYRSAISAQNAGAPRIELCSELAVGGITPSYGFLKKVMKELNIPVHVLIRPRSGNFTYSNEEFEIMKEDILICHELGCAGIVSGILLPDLSVDIKRTQELVDLSKPMNFTFHRAFDWVQEPMNSIITLERIGVDRVLTSGQENTAEEGITLLKKLQKETNIAIMPGGGVSIDNALLFKKAGFSEIHASLTTLRYVNLPPMISMNSSKHFSETQLASSNTDTIKQLLGIINP